MNPLLAELHRRYAKEGVPSLTQQARDLVALAHLQHQEQQAAAIRALEGYRAALTVRERRPVRSIWDRKAGGRGQGSGAGENLPAVLREQAE